MLRGKLLLAGIAIAFASPCYSGVGVLDGRPGRGARAAEIAEIEAMIASNREAKRVRALAEDRATRQMAEFENMTETAKGALMEFQAATTADPESMTATADVDAEIQQALLNKLREPALTPIEIVGDLSFRAGDGTVAPSITFKHNIKNTIDKQGRGWRLDFSGELESALRPANPEDIANRFHLNGGNGEVKMSLGVARRLDVVDFRLVVNPRLSWLTTQITMADNTTQATDDQAIFSGDAEVGAWTGPVFLGVKGSWNKMFRDAPQQELQTKIEQEVLQGKMIFALGPIAEPLYVTLAMGREATFQVGLSRQFNP